MPSHSPFSPQILFVGLNPAWQKTLVFERFRPGEVNRADRLEELASGKAVNAARAATLDGGQATVAQFAGGEAGDKLVAALAGEGIDAITVPIHSATRTCTTVLDRTNESMTELIEPSPVVSAAEVEALRGRLAGRMASFAGVALCGTYPPGVSADFYADIIAAQRGRTPILLDAFTGVNCAIERRPDILKINQIELNRLVGCGADVARGVRRVLDRWGIPGVAVTDGPRSAILGTASGVHKLCLPKLDRVVNPLGAGDTATAIFLVRLCRAIARREIAFPLNLGAPSTSDVLAGIFADALAAASASCLTARPGLFDPRTASDLRGRIEISVETGNV